MALVRNAGRHLSFVGNFVSHFEGVSLVEEETQHGNTGCCHESREPRLHSHLVFQKSHHHVIKNENDDGNMNKPKKLGSAPQKGVLKNIVLTDAEIHHQAGREAHNQGRSPWGNEPRPQWELLFGKNDIIKQQVCKLVRDKSTGSCNAVPKQLTLINFPQDQVFFLTVLVIHALQKYQSVPNFPHTFYHPDANKEHSIHSFQIVCIRKFLTGTAILT